MAGETQDYSLLVPYRLPVGIVYVPPPTGIAATDTANIQNALNQSTSISPKRIVLQPGTYQLNAQLAVPLSPGMQIVGQGPVVTAIQQNTAGVPIFAFLADNTNTIRIADMTAQYATAQSNALSQAFYYHVAGGTSGGFYLHTYENLYIKNAYDGFAVEEADNFQPIWDITWRKVTFQNIARSLVRLKPATAGGMLGLNFYDIYSGSAPTVAGAEAFVFQACEVNMIGMDLEKWTDTLFHSYGGGRLSIRQLHVESHTFAANFSHMATVYDATILDVDGFRILNSANTSTNTDFCVLFRAPNAGPIMTIKNGAHQVTTTNGAAYVTEVAFQGTPGTANVAIKTENIQKIGGGLNQPLTGSHGRDIAEYSPMQTPRQYRIVTSAYNHQQSDGMITVNAASAVQVTLLDPTTSMVGVPVTVKNVTANTVTIASAGVSKTIDGAASTTLAQWAKASFVSDGTQWLSV